MLGSYTLSPFKFQIANVNEIWLSSSNLVFPQGRSFRPDVLRLDALREYQSMLHCTGSENNQQGTVVMFYANFYSIFA